MSAEESHLDAYRAEVIFAVRDAGEQQALGFDRAWADAAEEALERLASAGYEFTADDLIAEVGSPSSPGATGAAFAKASSAGLIRAVGVRTSRRISRHAGLQRVWRGRTADD